MVLRVVTPCLVTVAGSWAAAEDTLFWVKMASRSGSDPMSKVTCMTIEPSLALGGLQVEHVADAHDGSVPRAWPRRY